jgi:hypothetical protein
MADRLHPADLIGRRIFWLLEINWAGATIRLSDLEVDVTAVDGTVRHFDGSLDTIDVDEGIDFLADASASPPSAAIAAVFPVDVPLLVAQGHDMAGATGVLSRWIEGTAYGARRVVINGQVVDPEYGASDDPVSFSLELTPWSDSKTIPPANAAVLSANWDAFMIGSLPTGGVGRLYPIVIGKPGVVSTGTYDSGRVSGSQGVYVDQQSTGRGGSNVSDVTIVLAGHHVTASSVFMNTNTDTDGRRYPVVNGVDRAGNQIAYSPWYLTKPAAADAYVWDATYLGVYTWGAPPSATVIGPIGVAGAPSSIRPGPKVDHSGVFVSWSDLDDVVGGGLADASGNAMRGAGDVLEWLMLQSGVPVDLGRFAAAKSLLSGFKLDFTIDAETTPWEYVTAHILPILPVSIVSGPDGVYPVVWRYDALASDSVAAIDTGLDPYVQRASNVSYDRSNVVNAFSLTYALSVRTSNYAGALRYAAEGTTGATTNYYCTLSKRRYARPDGADLESGKAIETPCIYDNATAHAVLQWMSRAFCLARRRIEYIAPESTYGWLERGHVVTITDADLHLTNQVALVESIRIDGSPMLRIKLLIIEETVRDARPLA